MEKCAWEGMELCMRHLDPRKHSCVRVWDPRQLYRMFPCTKIRKQSSADCCRRSKVCTTRIRSSRPYHIDTQNAVCATCMYANIDWPIFRTRKRGHACVSYTRVKSVLLLWTPSLNDCSKLKGECTAVKSGCGPSVGPSLNPHSLS